MGVGVTVGPGSKVDMERFCDSVGVDVTVGLDSRVVVKVDLDVELFEDASMDSKELPTSITPACTVANATNSSA